MFKVPVLPLPRPGPPTLLPVLTLPLHPLLISLHRYRRLNPRPSCLHILHHHVIVICDPISTKKTWISVLRIKFHHRYFSSRLLKSHFHACLTTVIDEIIRVIIPFKPRACMRSKKPRLMRWWSECVHCIGYCTDEGFVEFPGSWDLDSLENMRLCIMKSYSQLLFGCNSEGIKNGGEDWCSTGGEWGWWAVF